MRQPLNQRSSARSKSATAMAAGCAEPERTPNRLAPSTHASWKTIGAFDTPAEPSAEATSEPAVSVSLCAACRPGRQCSGPALPAATPRGRAGRRVAGADSGRARLCLNNGAPLPPADSARMRAALSLSHTRLDVRAGRENSTTRAASDPRSFRPGGGRRAVRRRRGGTTLGTAQGMSGTTRFA